MIKRVLEARLRKLARSFPVITVTGPRQSGKTTLCRATFDELPWVSLEEPDIRAYAKEDPRGLLSTYRDGAIFDEIQRAPALTSYLQTMVDEDPRPGRFVLTGSQNLAVTRATNQSLAGRTAMVHLLPLERAEIRTTRFADDDLTTTLWRGGYPAIFARPVEPAEWLSAYTATYLERDVRELLNVGDLSLFQTFLSLCAGRVGTLLNLSALGADAGVSHTTARSWLSVLEASFVAFRLRPWHRNLGKRLTRSPKLYFYDTGLVCWLLGIREPGHLARHPLRGAIFENWVIAELIKQGRHRGLEPRAWFYRDRSQIEVDALLERGDHRVAIEAKSGQTIGRDFFAGLQRFRDLWAAAGDELPLRTVLVYGGDRDQPRTPTAVLSWRNIDQLAEAPTEPA